MITIEQLQAYVDSKPDIRELVNVIVDYIENNPGAGGSGTLDQVLNTGDTATGKQLVLRIDDDSNAFFIKNISGAKTQVSFGADDAGNGIGSINGIPIITVRTADNFADDAAAAIGGIEIGKGYHTSGSVKIRFA